jgi:hypothetical protein
VLVQPAAVAEGFKRLPSCVQYFLQELQLGEVEGDGHLLQVLQGVPAW